ncbi:hypothetical protein B5G50_19490 [Brevibacillus brevis]|nr:hypothetical protein B5G50_19490 [Brevibacillus brevis]
MCCSLIFFINKWHIKYKYSQNKDRIKEIQEYFPKIPDDLQTNSVIPEAYWSSAALIVLEQYLINKRADNLKECLNLYEIEQRHHQTIAQLDEIRNLQISIYNQLD